MHNIYFLQEYLPYYQSAYRVSIEKMGNVEKTLINSHIPKWVVIHRERRNYPIGYCIQKYNIATLHYKTKKKIVAQLSIRS